MAEKKKGAQLLDRLALLFLGATGLVCVCYLLLLVLPTNPLAPPTPVEVVRWPTLAPSNTPLPPTVAATNTPTPRFTNTPVVGTPPTIGPTPTVRATITRPPTRTPSPTYGPSLTPSPTRSKFPFTAEIAPQVSPFGCNWAGLMGTVFDLQGEHLAGYTIHIKGDASIDKLVNSGNSQFKMVPGYGESAWDLPINASGVTAGTWFVRLYEPGTNAPVSDTYEIRLEAACGVSSMFIKFVQNH